MRRFFTRSPRPACLRPATLADAPALADIHAGSFAHPWSIPSFEAMLADRAVHGHVAETTGPIGFILSRIAADEAEILSVAVHPKSRGAGIGARLVAANLDALARARVSHVFLEVESNNQAALAVYRAAGFAMIGTRPGYYRYSDGTRHDAVMMRLAMAGRMITAPLADA
ncbi:MAG: ribosomal protein S18-alanine N-acetyltransferase [Proteobacteria bacterium]|nr:ribosomal protein S18-alanine N-acetyltransferase [Pseudomonadota bacterium]